MVLPDCRILEICAVVDLPMKTVAAQQQEVAPPKAILCESGVRAVGMPIYRVSLRRGRVLFDRRFGDFMVPDQQLPQRMILGDLLQLSLPEQIDPAVACMHDRGLGRIDQCQGKGRSRAVDAGLPLGLLVDKIAEDFHLTRQPTPPHP